MTARQLFENALTELNKVHAPSLILKDYNYFINKAVSQYINKVYNLFEINQQRTDDLRVLRSTAVLIPNVNDDYGTEALFNNIYEAYLPDDYLHILNCVTEFQFTQTSSCYSADQKIQVGAKRMTSDMFPQLINNHYFKPSYKNPYFYINNVNTSNNFPTKDNSINVTNNDYIDISGDSPANLLGYYKVGVYGKTGIWYYYYTNTSVNKVTLSGNFTIGGQVQGSTTKTYFTRSSGSFITDGVVVGSLINTGTSGPDPITAKVVEVTASKITLDLYNDEMLNTTSLYLYNIPEINSEFVQKIAENRYGNRSKVRMEIRYGKNTNPALNKIYVDYLKTPQYISLTEDQIDDVEDNSQILEFPDYVCQEILNELIKLLMENASDPRLQTNIPINQSIASPGTK